jgi:hypothetical protein
LLLYLSKPLLIDRALSDDSRLFLHGLTSVLSLFHGGGKRRSPYIVSLLLSSFFSGDVIIEGGGGGVPPLHHHSRTQSNVGASVSNNMERLI